MNDDPLLEEVPPWPPLAGVAALAGSSVVALVATLLAAVVAAGAGVDSPTPATVLLFSGLTAVGTLTVVAFLASLTEPMHPRQLGLRAAPAAAIAVALAVAAGLGILLALWSLVVDLGGTLSIPGELDPRSTLARTYDLSLREGVDVGPGLLASALARCVLPAVVGEVLLRGFAFPALARWRGPLPAALVVAVLFGGVFDLAGGAALAVPSIVLGGVLCAVYVVTGSLLPGIALSAAASGVAFGASAALGAGETAAVAVGSAVVAVALVAPFARSRRGARSRMGSLTALRRRIA